MNYTKITIHLEPFDQTSADILTAEMGEIGFESFVEIDNGFEGYIQTNNLNISDLDNLDPIVDGIKYSWTQEAVPDQDWNEEWEKNFFQPIVIADKCLIRSPFHEKTIETEYEIVINPKMAFGTGHHETTSLMIREILKRDFTGKRVLDMGCGTGILTIMASMRGAEKVIGIDIDDWCYSNSIENLLLNNINCAEILIGDASLLAARKYEFDAVLANINRNILLNDMQSYVDSMKNGATLIISGFYTEDVAVLCEKAESLELKKISQNEDNRWNVLVFEKKEI